MAFPALLFVANPVMAADGPSITLAPVVVVETKPVDPLAGTTLVGGSGLARQRAATSGTAGLLGDVPGLSLFGGGGVSSLPTLHGLADDRLRIKVDGMDLISACANHMNPPLSYIDPSNVGSIEVFGGITPVSAGGDSIGGTIRVNSPSPEFAAAGQGTLTKGQAGTFYRSNGNVRGMNLAATFATEALSLHYNGSTVESGNYTAGGDFKPAGLAFKADGKSIKNSTVWLPADEVGSSMYKSTNQSLSAALRSDNHFLELKLGMQNIPFQGFPNQRMDMTANDSEQINLRYKGQYQWGTLDARVYDEHTRHKMNFLEDKAYWYMGNAPGMPMDTEGKSTGALVKADIELSARDKLTVGGELQRYRMSDWWVASGTGGMSPNTFKNITDGQRDRADVFAEWEARWSPQWLTQLGARAATVEMNSGLVQGYNSSATYLAEATAFNKADRQRTDHNVDLSALGRYTPNQSQTIEFGYSQKTRSPNLYERFAWSTGGMAMNMVNWFGDGNGYVGNLALKPEMAHTLSATADWHDDAKTQWGVKVSPYLTYVQDYIDARRCRSANSSCGAANQNATTGFVFLQLANQSARIYGIDLSGYQTLASNTGWGNLSVTGMLSYVKGTNESTGSNLYNMMPLNAKLAVVQNLNQWTNTAEVKLVSAKTDVSAVRNELPTAGYGLLNLRSSYAWKQVRVDVGVDNALNKSYADPMGGAYVGQGTTMPPMGGAAYGLAVPGIGRTVYVGLNVKF